MYEILKTLIPVGAALLGGLIGFIGAIVASGRTTKANLEQARISRLRERQYEVFASLYGHMNLVEELGYSNLVHADSDEDLQSATAAMNDAIIELNRYLLRNRLWLPDEIAQATADFSQRIYTKQRQYVKLSDGDFLSTTDPQYREKKERFKDWMHGTGHNLKLEVYRLISEYLNLDDLKARIDEADKPQDCAPYTAYFECW